MKRILLLWLLLTVPLLAQVERSGSYYRGAEKIILEVDQSVLEGMVITLEGMTGDLLWGDRKSNFIDGTNTTYTHSYETEGQYKARIIGKINDLVYIDLSGNPITTDVGQISLLPVLLHIDLADLNLPPPSVTTVLENLVSVGNINGYCDLTGSASVIDSSDAALIDTLISRGWLVFADGFGIELTNDQSVLAQTSIRLAGAIVDIDWGDGEVTTTTTADVTYTKDYASTGTYLIRITGALGDLTKYEMTNQANLVLDLSVFRQCSNLATLNLSNCPLITGDLSDVSSVSYYLRLYNCPLITGDLSDVSSVSYYLRLSNCSLITGDLSDVSVSYYLNLSNCPLITGDLSDVSVGYNLDLSNCPLIAGSLPPTCTATIIYLTSCGLSQTEVDNNLININTANRSNGQFYIAGTNASRSSASDQAIIDLVDRGWTITANGGSYGPQLTSGLLEIGEDYYVELFIAGDNFTNVGGTNTTGETFTASGTTPTTWTNLSELREVL